MGLFQLSQADKDELKKFIDECVNTSIDKAIKEKLASEVKVAELIKEEQAMQARLQEMMPKLERAVNEIAGRVP